MSLKPTQDRVEALKQKISASRNHAAEMLQNHINTAPRAMPSFQFNEASFAGIGHDISSLPRLPTKPISI